MFFISLRSRAISSFRELNSSRSWCTEPRLLLMPFPAKPDSISCSSSSSSTTVFRSFFRFPNTDSLGPPGLLFGAVYVLFFVTEWFSLSVFVPRRASEGSLLQITKALSPGPISESAVGLVYT